MERGESEGEYNGEVRDRSKVAGGMVVVKESPSRLGGDTTVSPLPATSQCDTTPRRLKDVMKSSEGIPLMVKEVELEPTDSEAPSPAKLLRLLLALWR